MGGTLAFAVRLRHLRCNLIADFTPSITLSSRALDVITRETAQADDGRETGGILLGMMSQQEGLVLHAGGPGPHAVRTPTTFLRDRTHAQAFAHACWSVDGSVWIGDWHSHPNVAPVPSVTDLDTYMSLLADTQLRFETFISLITTPTSTGIAVAGWWCNRLGAHAAHVRVKGDHISE
jgi:integrative and conjugative element protein (TIGR02256 family)